MVECRDDDAFTIVWALDAIVDDTEATINEFFADSDEEYRDFAVQILAHEVAELVLVRVAILQCRSRQRKRACRKPRQMGTAESHDASSRSVGARRSQCSTRSGPSTV